MDAQWWRQQTNSTVAYLRVEAVLVYAKHQALAAVGVSLLVQRGRCSRDCVSGVVVVSHIHQGAATASTRNILRVPPSRVRRCTATTHTTAHGWPATSAAVRQGKPHEQLCLSPRQQKRGRGAALSSAQGTKQGFKGTIPRSTTHVRIYIAVASAQHSLCRSRQTSDRHLFNSIQSV